MADAAPRWQLDSVYPGFDSAEFARAKEDLARLARETVAHAEQGPASPGDLTSSDRAAFLAWLRRAIELRNEASGLAENLTSYCYAAYTVDTTNRRAMTELNAVETIAVPFARANALYLDALARSGDVAREAARTESWLSPYESLIDDELFWQTRQMPAAEEDLASDLARSGASAWGRLQEQMTSTAGAVWDKETGERKTLVELRSLAHDGDRATRAKAFALEIETCKSIEIPVAAAINGVKGWAISLNARRRWDEGSTSASAIGKATRQGQISRKALAALVEAMEESLPAWRRYLRAKARLLGVERLPFYDLFAPIGGAARRYSFAEARDAVVSNFARFSGRMADFAARAIDSGWVDAEPRPGKIGGAYFTQMPVAREGRVMLNFDGTFSSVLTLAHELGHAFHAEVLKDVPFLLQRTPMTLAETASIFAETVVHGAELARASGDERLGLLETQLQDGCQILVDILSRFYFERALFDARKDGEVAPAELCRMMEEAQRATYGDGLDPGALHPYMWLVKTHYYSSDLGFYNFPYAFGQLFALALYARGTEEGPAFQAAYEAILRDTGSLDAIEVARRAGFDVETASFWRGGISVFAKAIDEFERIAAGFAPAGAKRREEKDR